LRAASSLTTLFTKGASPVKKDKKKSPKKLKLDRQTLRLLNERELPAIAGGATARCSYPGFSHCPVFTCVC
jgi:hypothetical protein